MGKCKFVLLENDFFVNFMQLTSVYDKVSYRESELGIYLSKRIEQLS